jgi:hypothetical protein
MTAIGMPGTSRLPACGAARSLDSAGRTSTSKKRILRIGATRVDVGGRAFDQDEPKTANAGRVLPIPEALLAELAAAKNRQASEKLALGEAYTDRATSCVTRPASRTIRRPSAGCGGRPSAISACRRFVCTTRGTRAPPLCTYRLHPSPSSRRGWVTPTSRSLCAPTFVPNQKR